MIFNQIARCINFMDFVISPIRTKKKFLSYFLLDRFQATQQCTNANSKKQKKKKNKYKYNKISLINVRKYDKRERQRGKGRQILKITVDKNMLRTVWLPRKCRTVQITKHSESLTFLSFGLSAKQSFGLT